MRIVARSSNGHQPFYLDYKVTQDKARGLEPGKPGFRTTRVMCKWGVKSRVARRRWKLAADNFIIFRGLRFPDFKMGMRMYKFTWIMWMNDYRRRSLFSKISARILATTASWRIKNGWGSPLRLSSEFTAILGYYASVWTATCRLCGSTSWPATTATTPNVGFFSAHLNFAGDCASVHTATCRWSRMIEGLYPQFR